jgi:D-lyxose ketol-isomerase
MMSKPGQISPMHFHWSKMEDIINRGGGDLAFTLYNAAPDETLSDGDVKVVQDGRTYTVKAGSEVILKPGQSLTLYPYCYHAFTAAPGGGPVLIGEVSMCNDDNNDNRFLEQLGRFPAIEADEKPYRLLCTEYPGALKRSMST